MIGRTVSHYRIVERLGAGSMGVVYRAEDVRLGRDVALKFLPAELTQDPAARQRFTQEARAASALDHANICAIHDIGETPEGQLFIAMAFYGGETLKSRLEAGPVPVEEALDLARQIAAGLARAHAQGIVHRDVKPANLMVTGHGEVKIVDFGIAKLAGEAGLTHTGAALGTLAYMSPEQADASSEAGPATDLWALGVVLYELLTGTNPFARGSARETVSAIVALTPDPPGRLVEGVPPEVDDLVGELLAKSPRDRPRSADEVGARLGAMIRPPREAVPFFARPGTWIGLAAAGVLVALALVLPARRRAALDAARASIPEMAALAADGRYDEAYALGVRAEEQIPGDTTLQRLMQEVSDRLTVRTDPAGAEVRVRRLSASSSGAGDPSGTSLGTTPIVDLRLPRRDHLLTIEREGFEPVERLVSSDLLRAEAIPRGESFDLEVDVELQPAGSIPPGMVHVPGGEYTLLSADAPLGATARLSPYLIDRFETTNAEFSEFVRAGGYADRALWPAAMPDGSMASFVDRTGLPGPRGWSEQRFPDGAARLPVTGINWYEAAAYCAWREKSLPTIYEWEKAARDGAFTHFQGMVLPWGLVTRGEPLEARANFASDGTVEVDAHPFGMSPYGAYAMAGNVWEFTSNRAEGGYIALGASWQDLAYQFSGIATREGDGSSPTHGVRCVRREAPAEAQGAGLLELARISPTYTPVDEATYRSFLTHYRYDPIELEPETVDTVETAEWTRVTVRFNGLGGDRMLAYLYLPRASAPPYQTLVQVPSLTAFFAVPVDVFAERTLGAHIRAGRAVLAVVLDGMVGRAWPEGTAIPASNTVEFRNLMVKHATELSLSLDYLETRGDIDPEALAYVGVSWGAGSRSLLAAIDDRWDAVIFVGAGIDERLHPTVPEALNVNFLPYIDAPKLVVNGRQDEEHPWLSRGKPFYDLLSEPKTLVLRDQEGHRPSPEVLVPAIHDFLDDVFGPVRR